MRTIHHASTRRGLAAAVAVIALMLTGCAAPGPEPAATSTPSATTPAFPAETATALQDVLDAAPIGDTLPGVIARVVTADGTWTGTAGATAPGVDEMPTAVDRTRIGSLTKTMTATILLQLVGEGLVSLDDPIAQYVADSPNGSATLRQLADMTSGIPSYSLAPDWQTAYFADPERVFTSQELLDYAKALPVDGAPGEKWVYSNTNYLLLGLVIEQVTAQPMEDVFAARLFEPLGMDDSVYPGESADIAEPHLRGVTQQGQADDTTVDATDWNPSFGSTAGEVISTLDDLTLWADALFTGEGVLTPELQQLRRDSILSSPPPNSADGGYGLGWGQRPDGWWGHSGTIPGYTTSLFHSYDLDATIIVVTSSDIAFPDGGGEPAPTLFAELAAALG
ncbi:serine hydrolase domain-containing protein [Microbacterium sp. M3]|uniref:Serine hydrolase domain-containing protein n=1 Tax=Microbacterium arthrosphaerae TaxID=792652 RepID=A0ABU4H708_9MICO|nr:MULTISPECIES: serine hydrolase domain-containing protein [Microbacterium]MDW4573664.1 serine hydrolase domain-containing protein [Microbacterium arthrosphaerae]MDW7607519.1 serine hydrolase domain-containing protein [Microbacterium sp. M3]